MCLINSVFSLTWSIKTANFTEWLILISYKAVNIKERAPPRDTKVNIQHFSLMLSSIIILATGPPSSNVTEICCLPPPSLPPPFLFLQSSADCFHSTSGGVSRWAASMERLRESSTQRCVCTAVRSSCFIYSECCFWEAYVFFVLAWTYCFNLLRSGVHFLFSLAVWDTKDLKGMTPKIGLGCTGSLMISVTSSTQPQKYGLNMKIKRQLWIKIPNKEL